jgi:hypothetical protein
MLFFSSLSVSSCPFVPGRLSGAVPTNNIVPGWAGAHVHLHFYQADALRDVILLDNQSSASIFCNPKFVQDIQETNEELILLTNGCEIRNNLKATIPDFGEVWYNPKAITNIFSFADMENLYKITYDTSQDQAFVVHLPSK